MFTTEIFSIPALSSESYARARTMVITVHFTHRLKEDRKKKQTLILRNINLLFGYCLNIGDVINFSLWPVTWRWCAIERSAVAIFEKAAGCWISSNFFSPRNYRLPETEYFLRHGRSTNWLILCIFVFVFSFSSLERALVPYLLYYFM